jgi:IS1 family transposase/transposase-like protein
LLICVISNGYNLLKIITSTLEHLIYNTTSIIKALEMVSVKVSCVDCSSENVIKNGTQSGCQRILCNECGRSFQLSYCQNIMNPGVREKISEMSINASGTRDISRVLCISKNSVTKELKKKAKEVQDVNPRFIGKELEVEIVVHTGIQAELDEQWSYVKNKKNQRWLWYAIEKRSGDVLAFVFGRRTDDMCAKLMDKLSVFDIKKFFTDDWGSYSKMITPGRHFIGKAETQKIENRNLSLRTRIKRLARKTICFSKLEELHDGVIGMFINKCMFNNV